MAPRRVMEWPPHVGCQGPSSRNHEQGQEKSVIYTKGLVIMISILWHGTTPSRGETVGGDKQI
jgi:hypothetical protein